MGNLFPYLKNIHVNNCYASQDFKIDFSPQDGKSFRHLILTGKNGSGKTTILQELNEALEARINSSSKVCITSYGEIENLKQVAFFPAYRNLEIASVEGAKKLKSYSGKELLQYLVNKKTFQANEFLEKQERTPFVEEIHEWFKYFENGLKQLFGLEEFKLEYDGKEFEFYCLVPNQEKFTLKQLSSGYNSVLYIFAELLLIAESQEVNNKDFSTIVLIDEIETHLHLELQETILPFLTGMFPKVQFIVATHSPAVIASIDNATVYDLSQHKTIDEDLRGYPYQFLMKEHFGIESEYSVAATKLLNEARTLMSKGNERTEQESNKLRQLAKQLHELSPNLAFELFLELERQQLESA